MKKFFAFTIFIAIIFVAIFFRINHITDSGITTDEGQTYFISSAENLNSVFDRTTSYDRNPPGYYLILHPFVRLLGQKEELMRTFPIIFSILSIVFLYLILSLTINRRTALVGSFLVATSSLCIGYSIESRMFMLLTLFTLSSYFFLLKALKHPEFGTKFWIYFSVSCLAGLYTHYLFLVYLIGFFATFLILVFNVEEKMKKVLMLALSLIAMIIGYAFWIPSIRHHLDVEYYRFTSNDSFNIFNTLKDFANGDLLLFMLITVLLIVALVIRRNYEKDEIKKEKQLYTFSFCSFLLIGILIPILYSIWIEPVFGTDSLIALTPILMAITAIGLWKLSKLHWSLILPIIAIIFLLNTPWNNSLYPKAMGQDFRGVIEYVKENEFPIIVHSPKNHHALRFYNQTNIPIKPLPYTNDFREYTLNLDSENKFKDLVKDIENFYLVIEDSKEDPKGLIVSWSHNTCKNYQILNIRGLSVYFFSNCSLN
ncbi:glycosyltransferase family 39 protein [Patescibacteria group bacterium]